MVLFSEQKYTSSLDFNYYLTTHFLNWVLLECHLQRIQFLHNPLLTTSVVAMLSTLTLLFLYNILEICAREEKTRVIREKGGADLSHHLLQMLNLNRKKASLSFILANKYFFPGKLFSVFVFTTTYYPPPIKADYSFYQDILYSEMWNQKH